MFNPRKFFGFWSSFLGFHFGLIFGVVFILAFLTEFITRSAPVTSSAFWLAVSVNILPGILVVIILLRLTSRFVQAVYNLDSKWAGFLFIIRHRFGQPGFRPYIRIGQGQLPPNADSVLTRVGGKGSLIIGNDSAVLLEQSGRLTEVKGPGFYRLKPFEKIYAAIDLRPKLRTCPVNAMTQEGIPITWQVEVRYQIADDGQQPTEKMPYLFSEGNVFLAATCNWQRKRESVNYADIMDWEELIIARTQGILRSILARFSLDQLIDLTETHTQAVRETIQKELTQNLSEKVAELGAKILGVKLGKLQVDDQVTQQWIKTWQTRWKRMAAQRFVETDGGPIVEMAKTEARMLPLTTLYHELEKQDSNQAITFMALTYFLFRLEGRMRSEATSQVFLPNQVSPKPEPRLESETKEATPPLLFSKPKQTPSALPKPTLKVLPIIAEVAAGKEKPSLDDVTGYIHQIGKLEFRLAEQAEEQILKAKLLKGTELRFLKEYKYIATQISGDSMDQTGISSGDYVILQKSGHPANRDIVVIVFRDETGHKVTLKRMIVERDDKAQPVRIILQPESSNPTYKPRVLPPDAFAGDNPTVWLAGTAVAVLKPQD